MTGPITLLDLDAAGMDLSQPAAPAFMDFLYTNAQNGYVTLWSTLLDEFNGLKLIWDWINTADELHHNQYRLNVQFVAPPTPTKPAGAGVTEITYSWIPVNAKIHIDFLGGTPQGRAWVDGTGEVAINTLLGTDPNTSTGWGPSLYNPAYISASGYLTPKSPDDKPPAFIGAARTLVTRVGGFTMRVQLKRVVDIVGSGAPTPLMLLSTNGNDALQVDFVAGVKSLRGTSMGGPLSVSTLNCMNIGASALNAAAFTIAGPRYEHAGNGSAVATGVIGASDRPPANPLVAALIYSVWDYIQSITLYDALPTTAGLSELSQATP